ncbi:unnamed protein product [Calypogeia fissa]
MAYFLRRKHFLQLSEHIPVVRCPSQAQLGLYSSQLGRHTFLTGTAINTYCSFEDSYSAYATTYSDSPSWVNKYPASKFWHIVHTTPSDQASVQTGVSLSKTRHAGYIYFTDAVGTSPSDNPHYDVAPSPIVWQTEVAGAKKAT